MQIEATTTTLSSIGWGPIVVFALLSGVCFVAGLATWFDKPVGMTRAYFNQLMRLRPVPIQFLPFSLAFGIACVDSALIDWSADVHQSVVRGVLFVVILILGCVCLTTFVLGFTAAYLGRPQGLVPPRWRVK